MDEKKKRIVVTGMGIMTPIGDNLDDYYNNLIAGKSAISRWRSIDVENIRSKVGGDMGDYDHKAAIKKLKEEEIVPQDVLKRMRKILKTAPLSARLTSLAAVQAYQDADLFGKSVDTERICAILGGHNFNSNYIYENFKQFQEEPEYISGMMGICVYDTDIITSIAEILEIHGPVYSIGGTCTSSGMALKQALHEIRYNDSKIAVVTGGVLDYSPLDLQALILVSAISYQNFNNDPEKASRPYDTAREGFVPSHGGGVLILEELDHAIRRNARIYAEVVEVESSSDGNHLSNPSVAGQSRLMSKVLKRAGMKPEDVDYVNAHATSTPMGDRVEIASIGKVFGEHSKRIKVNATKSMIGHAGWSAAAVEIIGSILQMNHNKLHPSINIDEMDPEINLDVCANEAKDWEVNCFMKNSFGFGGLNCCTLVKKFVE